MPQFGVDFDRLFQFEVMLSPERYQSKRDTLNMVQLLQAFGAFRGAMTLIGLSLVGSYSANAFKNEMAKCFISEGGSSSQKGDVNEFTAGPLELFMMTFFCSCFVKSEKLKNMKQT